MLSRIYAKLGDIKKGIQTIESCMSSYRDTSDIGYTDYHILGLLYVKNNDFKKALEIFKKQLEMTEDFPESYYYQALAYLGNNQIELAKKSLENAQKKFQNPNQMRNGYHCFKAYPIDVKNALNSLNL